MIDRQTNLHTDSNGVWPARIICFFITLAYFTLNEVARQL
eukprot:SAG31_NODE_38095_length_299_cov_0.630000_1_plen_39_part_10